MVIKKEFSEKELKHKGRRLSIKEGMITSAQNSVGDQFISPFAIAANMSSSMVSAMSSISGLIGPISQIYGAKLYEKTSRKKVMTKMLFLRSLIWPILIVLAILFQTNILVGKIPLMILVFFSMYTIFANLSYPAWFSWMGDLVDSEYRGRWFAKRSMLVGLVSVITSLIASSFLDYFKNNSWIIYGFITLFAFAFIFRMISISVLRRQYEPKKIKSKIKEKKISFWKFLRESPKNNFGRFVIFRGAWGLACSVSSPLIAVYLLRNLGLSYFQYSLVIMAGTIGALFFVELFGRISDKCGNYKILFFTGAAITIIPLLWIASKNIWYLIFVPSLIEGIVWAGFNLAAENFVYENAIPGKRGMSVSYYSVIHGIGIFLGAGLGAILINIFENNFAYSVIIVFAISSLLRIAVILVIMPKVKEIRKVNGRFKHIFIKEIKPTIKEEFHEITSINKYLSAK
jgi:MFS family permease